MPPPHRRWPHRCGRVEKASTGRGCSSWTGGRPTSISVEVPNCGPLTCDDLHETSPFSEQALLRFAFSHEMRRAAPLIAFTLSGSGTHSVMSAVAIRRSVGESGPPTGPCAPDYQCKVAIRSALLDSYQSSGITNITMIK